MQLGGAGSNNPVTVTVENNENRWIVIGYTITLFFLVTIWACSVCASFFIPGRWNWSKLVWGGHNKLIKCRHSPLCEILSKSSNLQKLWLLVFCVFLSFFQCLGRNYYMILDNDVTIVFINSYFIHNWILQVTRELVKFDYGKYRANLVVGER